MDIFQFFASSADAAPGKGTGETLMSSPEVYKPLRAVKNWRRLLTDSAQTPFTWNGSEIDSVDQASGEKKDRQNGIEELRRAKFTQNPEAKQALLLTQDAQLWYAPPRAPKVRWVELEALRKELKETEPRKEPEQNQMEPKKDDKSVKKTAKKTKEAKESKAPKLVTEAAENVLSEGVSASASASASSSSASSAPLTPLDTKEPSSGSIRFCPVCRYYLYLDKESEPGEAGLRRLCRNCGYNERDEKGGLISELYIGERATEGYKILLNEFTRADPRLPHIHGTIQCPDPKCKSNQSGQESDIIFMKYDNVNLSYLYICNVCDYKWHSRR